MSKPDYKDIDIGLSEDAFIYASSLSPIEFKALKYMLEKLCKVTLEHPKRGSLVESTTNTTLNEKYYRLKTLLSVPLKSFILEDIVEVDVDGFLDNMNEDSRRREKDSEVYHMKGTL